MPVGITAVSGEFHEGGKPLVSCLMTKKIARGMVNFSSADLDQIKGCNSHEITSILKIDSAHTEVIHRDNLVILR